MLIIMVMLPGIQMSHLLARCYWQNANIIWSFPFSLVFHLFIGETQTLWWNHRHQACSQVMISQKHIDISVWTSWTEMRWTKLREGQFCDQSSSLPKHKQKNVSWTHPRVVTNVCGAFLSFCTFNYILTLRFQKTLGWVNNNRFIIFGWTRPLTLALCKWISWKCQWHT